MCAFDKFSEQILRCQLLNSCRQYSSKLLTNIMGLSGFLEAENNLQFGFGEAQFVKLLESNFEVI